MPLDVGVEVGRVFDGYLDQESVRFGGQVGMKFQTCGGCGRGDIRKLVYDTDRLAILKGDLVGLFVDSNW